MRQRSSRGQVVLRDRKEKVKKPPKKLMFLWTWTPLPNNIISLLPQPPIPIPYRYGKIKLSFHLYSICLALCLSFSCVRFNDFHWFFLAKHILRKSMNLGKYYCKNLIKQSSGIQEWINPSYINFIG